MTCSVSEKLLFMSETVIKLSCDQEFWCKNLIKVHHKYFSRKVHKLIEAVMKFETSINYGELGIMRLDFKDDCVSLKTKTCCT